MLRVWPYLESPALPKSLFWAVFLLQLLFFLLKIKLYVFFETKTEQIPPKHDM